MGELTIERIGGLAGFGLPGSRIRSRGVLASETLSPADQAAVEALFRSGGRTGAPPVPDGFRYRLTRTTPKGPETIEAPEAAVPAALRDAVKDEFQ
jgi:hypothetical protein